MNELTMWISESGISTSARSAARAFWYIEIKTVEDLINYLVSDKDISKRPKGIGEDNYKILVEYARKFSAEENQMFISLTCSNGVGICGKLTKQDYAEFTGVVDALQLWFETHKLK